MYEASSFKVAPTIPYSVRYAKSQGAKLQKQAAGPLGRFVGKTLLSPFWLTGKLGSGIWNKGTRLLSPSLSMHPKRLGWLGRTFGGRQKVRRNAEAVELARAARAFSQPQRDRTFLQMRRQLANATGDRRAILEANMPNFDPATGLNRGKYFMRRAPDGRMHAKKTRVQGMNEFTNFLNRGTVPQGARATSTAQQAARQTQQAANTAQQAAANTAQSASRAQQTTQQAARFGDFNFRQPVDNVSFGPSFRQPVNNGGFVGNVRQPVGQGNYSVAADNAFNTLARKQPAKTNTAQAAPNVAAQSSAKKMPIEKYPGQMARFQRYFQEEYYKPKSREQMQHILMQFPTVSPELRAVLVQNYFNNHR